MSKMSIDQMKAESARLEQDLTARGFDRADAVAILGATATHMINHGPKPEKVAEVFCTTRSEERRVGKEC